MSAPSYDELLRAMADEYKVSGEYARDEAECIGCDKWGAKPYGKHASDCLHIRAKAHLPHHERMQESGQRQRLRADVASKFYASGLITFEQAISLATTEDGDSDGE